MQTSDFYYELPKELIAQTPIKNRDESRLLCVDKDTGALQHKVFKDIVDLLNPGDTLVLNESKVIPARLLGHIKGKEAAAEVFLLKRKEDNIWECLVRPGKKIRVGDRVIFGEGKLEAEAIEILPDGNRIIKFYYNGIWEEILESLGEMPLPPYIKEKLKNKDRYQTVYAKEEGSVAAPTAGLHFTDDLLDKIKAKGVNIAKLILHVSLGTFRPVKEDNIEDHIMHREEVIISEATAKLINDTKLNGKRVICVGTTSCRSIESAAVLNDETGKWELQAFHDETGIYIYPGYRFKLMDALITNFHLPESTLIMLVSAFAGREHVLNAYEEAKNKKYRFFSFGDACFFY